MKNNVVKLKTKHVAKPTSKPKLKRKFTIEISEKSAAGMQMIYSHICQKYPGMFKSINELAYVFFLSGSSSLMIGLSAMSVAGLEDPKIRASFHKIVKGLENGLAKPFDQFKDMNLRLNDIDIPHPSPVTEVT